MFAKSGQQYQFREIFMKDYSSLFRDAQCKRETVLQEEYLDRFEKCVQKVEKALESYEGDSDAITVDIKYEASCEELARDDVKHLQDNHLPCSYRHVESYYDRDNDCPEQYQVYIKLC